MQGRTNMQKKTLLAFAAFASISLSAFSACGQHLDFDPETISITETSISYSEGGNPPFVTTIGTIKNSSGSLIEDIVVEVKYFDADKKLIDVVTQPLYGLVVPASQELAFRVRDVADKPRAAYVSNSVRVVSAARLARQQPQKKQNPLWLDVLISWGPMLLLIAVWVIVMRRFNKKGSPQVRHVELIEKQNAILGRLASAVEKAGSDKQA